MEARVSPSDSIRSELYSCFESCLDSRETVVSLGTVARTPQSHDHVLVVSCIGASLLLSTMFTLSFVFEIFLV